MQALERTHPILPPRPDPHARQTRDHVRHGTVTLFAAPNTATGKVVTPFHERHRHQEVLSFLRPLNRTCPRRDLHLVWDDYATHRHDEVQQRLVEHPRITSVSHRPAPPG